MGDLAGAATMTLPDEPAASAALDAGREAMWTAIVHASGRQVAALVLAVLFLLETPVLVQFPDASTVGLIWQGRYSLPLWVGIPLTAYAVLALRQDGLPVRGLAERATVPALAVVLVVHAVMFRVAVPRFYVGLREPMELGAAPGYVGWALASLVVPALLLLVVLTPARLLPARLSRARARDGALTS